VSTLVLDASTMRETPALGDLLKEPCFPLAGY